MNHQVDKNADGSITVQAWVTDQQLAWVRAQGYENVGVVHDKYNIDHIRAERDADIAAEVAAKKALKTNAAGKAGPSAAPGTVRAQRGDFYENNVGRFISIEANTTQAVGDLHEPEHGLGLLVHRPGAAGGRVRREQQADRPGRADDLHRSRTRRSRLTTTSTTTRSSASATRATAARIRPT